MDVLTVKIAILLINNMLSFYIILTYFLITLKLYLKDNLRYSFVFDLFYRKKD
jgi:hypothetical protein